MKIVVISTISENIKLHELEFIEPILDILKEQGVDYEVVHISNVDKSTVGDKYIITGTSYQDNEFLNHKENIQYLAAQQKPILGICAGAELLLEIENILLENIIEIGPRRVKQVREDNFLKNFDGKECYFLHQKGIKALPCASNFEEILVTQQGVAAFRHKTKPFWGVQFHPEVAQKEIIAEFVKG